MKKYKVEELNEILDLHRKWLYGEVGGIRADMRGANLRDALRDLCGELLVSAKSSREWLNGWASADHQLGIINAAITKAENALGGSDEN